MEHDLALVVRTSPAPELVADETRLERCCLPERFLSGRLDVVMAVDQDCGCVRVIAGPGGEHRGMSGGLPGLDEREARVP